MIDLYGFRPSSGVFQNKDGQYLQVLIKKIKDEESALQTFETLNKSGWVIEENEIEEDESEFSKQSRERMNKEFPM